jgi:hypothetical protein
MYSKVVPFGALLKHVQVVQFLERVRILGSYLGQVF